MKKKLFYSTTYKEHEIEKIISLYEKVFKKIIVLEGDLGSGKTTFIAHYLHFIGEIDFVSSPTYSYVHTYKNLKNLSVAHFDLYRLPSEEAFYELGFHEYLTSYDIVFIEWPERISYILQAIDHTKIIFDYVNESERLLKLYHYGF